MSKPASSSGSRIPLSALPCRDWAAAGRTLRTDGVVHLAGALSRDALAQVDEAVEASFARPSEGAVNFYPAEHARFFQDRGQGYLPLVRSIGLDTMVDVIVFHLGILHGGGGTLPGMRRRTASLRFMGPDVVYDGRVRDEQGEQAGNDAALAHIYGQLEDGQPFHTLNMFTAVS